MHPTRSHAGCTVLAAAAALGAGAAAEAADRMPPYEGRAVDRIPEGKIQHIVFVETHTTTKDGRPPPDDEGELNHTQRMESWNSRRGGRMVSTLSSGRLLSHGGRAPVPVGAVIEESSQNGDTCRRWDPVGNIITRRRCTGVNDRETAVLEHSETGLAHHFRHRERSPYEIAVVRSGGIQQLRFRMTFEGRPDGAPAKTVGEVPEGAPPVARGRTVRTARLRRSTLRMLGDETVSRFERDGHAYVRVTRLRVVTRRLLPDTAENRALTRMDHPDATVKRGRATHEKPA